MIVFLSLNFLKISTISHLKTRKDVFNLFDVLAERVYSQTI
jgi:hypothetical protein